MKLLLDTHAVLWWLDDPLLLSLAARQAIAEPGNKVQVSAAVCWEIAIKRGLGKLTAPADLRRALQWNPTLHGSDAKPRFSAQNHGTMSSCTANAQSLLALYAHFLNLNRRKQRKRRAISASVISVPSC